MCPQTWRLPFGILHTDQIPGERTVTTATRFSIDTSDAELCREAQGNAADSAFKVLYDRYWARIYGVALGFVKNRDDATDVAQQTFVRAHRSLHRFKGEAAFYTWLYRIAVNCCKDWTLQAHQKRCSRMDNLWWSERAVDDALFGSDVRTDASVERRETRDVLAHAISELPAEFKTALVMREIDGMTYRQIGDALGCTEGTVKSRIFRARRLLRKALGGVSL